MIGYNIFCTLASREKTCTCLKRKKKVLFFFEVQDTHCIKGPPEWQNSCPYEILPKRPNVRPTGWGKKNGRK